MEAILEGAPRASTADVALALHSLGYPAVVRRALTSRNPAQSTTTLRNDFLVVSVPATGAWC